MAKLKIHGYVGGRPTRRAYRAMLSLRGRGARCNLRLLLAAYAGPTPRGIPCKVRLTRGGPQVRNTLAATRHKVLCITARGRV